MKKIITHSILILTIFIGGTIFADKPTNKDNILIYANKNGEARGYDLMWKAENITGTFAQESPVIRKDNIVYVTSINKDNDTKVMPGNNDLFALDAYTGEIISRYTIGPSFGDTIIEGNTLFIGTTDESWDGDDTWIDEYGVYSFDISDVKNNGFVLNWFHEVDGKVTPNILLDENNLYFSEFEGDKYIALSKADGHEVWSFTKGNYGAAFELMHGDFIYVANSYSGGNILYKLNKADGTEVWQKTIANRLWDNSITYSPDDDALFMTFYYDSAQKRAASYDMDGNERWTYGMHCKSLSFTSYHDHSVFFNDSCGWVYSLNSDTGVLEWEKQIGTIGNQITDIASSVVANGKIFIGTKGPGWDTVDSRGRGGFYILNEETGDVIWEYHESDLGDIMAVATITDGIFYNATNAWDVYAFDIGDGSSSDHLISTYDTDNTFSTETGLTQDRYVKTVCSNAGDETNCEVVNLYSGGALNVNLDMGDDVVESVLLNNGKYHININDSYIYLPIVYANGNLSNIKITSSIGSNYDTNFPRLIDIVQDSAYILESSYSPSDKKITIKVDNTNDFDAEIENYSRPFIGATSKLNNSNVSISKSGIHGIGSIISADMTVVESVGDNDINISRWDKKVKRWTEKGSDANNISSHFIEKLIPNKKYILTIDDDSQNIIADENGEFSFDTPIGNIIHYFNLKLFKKIKSKINYVCKDESASNYSQFGRHKQSKCEYSSNNDDKEISETELSESNPFGGELCSEDKIIHNFMKNGDTNWIYSNYNKGIITEVSLLQEHINRLLKEDYGEQAAGPIDIWFRLLTKRGVERIQKKLNQLLPDMKPLTIDGVVGPFTREAINNSC